MYDQEPLMLSYRHVTTFHRGSGFWQASIADLEFVTVNGRPTLAAATEVIGGGVTIYDIPTANDPMEQISGWGYSADFVYQQSPDMEVVRIGSQTYLHLSHIGQAEALGMSFRDNGRLGGFQQILPQEETGTGFSSLGQIRARGVDLIYASHLDGISLTVFHMADESGPAWVGEYSFDRPGLHADSSLDKVIDASVGQSRFLVAVSALGDFISTHQITNSGEILNANVHFNRAGSGISVPTDLSAIHFAGKTMIVVAAPGSSSLTVFHLKADGLLVPLDHVIDEGFTSFQGLSAFDTVTFRGRPFVFAGGTDGGITVFTILPDGKLLHLQTIADNFDMVLSDVSDIEAAVIRGGIAVFASSSTEAGITQLAFNPGRIGITGARQGSVVNGGDYSDMLLSLPETRRLAGGGGDDILVARHGAVTLTGGAGRDIFVPRKVNGVITISDFEPGRDQLDLSQLGSIRSIYQIDFLGNAARMRLSFDETRIDIFTSQGRALTEAYFTNDMFPIAHYVLPVMEREHVDPDTRVSDRGDHLFGTNSSERLTGGRGPDFIFARGGSDTVNAGLGNDTVHGQNGYDFLAGDSGEDLLYGAYGNDLIRGGDGNDRLFGGPGVDTLFGGFGADFLAGGAMRDLLFGLSGADTLKGGWGDDRAFGGNGDDLVQGDAGFDVLDGGFGNDTLIGGDMADRLTGGPGTDLLYGGYGRDTLIGGIGNDIIAGGADNDLLHGLSGQDHLFGGTGNDSLYGEAWGDTINGGEGGDYLSGGQGNDWLRGQSGDDTLLGGSEDDLLMGEEGRDRLAGGHGNDLLFGGKMDDVIFGNEGSDILGGGAGNDSLFAHAGNDLVRGALGDDLIGGGEGDDTLIGHGGHDRIEGHGGSDSLFGGFGDDTLHGGTGQDRIWGGPGNDVFVFRHPSNSHVSAPDRIETFDRRHDLIDVSDLNLRYIGGNVFSGDHQIRWAYHERDTHISADINGDGRADMKIILTGRHALTADDFLF